MGPTMTTIAFRDGIIASDTQATQWNTQIPGKTVKIRVVPADKFRVSKDADGNEIQKRKFGKLGGWVFAGCGSQIEIQALYDWLSVITADFDLSDRDAYEGAPEFECSSAILIPPSSELPLIMFTVAGPLIEPVGARPFLAIGTGSEFAYGALATGADAVDAVAAASKFDIYTSAPIQSYRIDGDDWVKNEDFIPAEGFGNEVEAE